MKKIVILLLALTFVHLLAILSPDMILAQNPDVWSGLKEPQTILPIGNAPFEKAIQKPFIETSTYLQQVSECEWIIDRGWRLSPGHCPNDTSFLNGSTFNAIVPGTVLTTLIEQGVFPDPYFGLNNMAIPEKLSQMDWWYEVDIPIPENTRASSERRFHLLFNGINYRSEIFLNSEEIGKTYGAFCRGYFDITDIVLPLLRSITPENMKLRVHVFPPDHPGIPHEQSILEGQGLNGGATSLDGPTFIASVGWDWMPGIRDRNIGIWQPVSLIVTGNVTIEDPMIITNLPLPDTSSSTITIETTLHNESGTNVNGVLKAVISYAGNTPGHSHTLRRDYVAANQEIIAEMPFVLAPYETKKVGISPESNPQLNIRNPHLWWPNGYGEQHLYQLELTASEERGQTESKVIPQNKSHSDSYSTESKVIPQNRPKSYNYSYQKEEYNSAKYLFSDLKRILFGIRELSYELMVNDSSSGGERVEWNPTERYTISSLQYPSQLSEKPILEPMFDNEKRLMYSKKNNLYIPSFVGSDRRGIKKLPQDDTAGPFLVIKVNGERIFCRGGNWGMDDALKRTSRERIEPAFLLHKDLNFNIIRNWTGETTQEVFYQLCDEYGMLVWNDFWMTGDDTVEPIDQALFLANATDVVRRYRNHPAIAIWCPRNEGFAPIGLEDNLAKMVAREDPTRHYHGQSRFLNMGTSGPWSYFEEPSKYFTERADGFNTEMGSFAIPTASTISKFIADEDLWPINDVWAYHDLHHTSQNFEGFMKAVKQSGGFDTVTFDNTEAASKSDDHKENISARYSNNHALTPQDAMQQDCKQQDCTPKNYVPKDYISRDYVQKDSVSRDYVSRDYVSRDYVSKDYVQKDGFTQDCLITFSAIGNYSPTNLAQQKMARFADVAQSICYDAWRAMIESWNSKMWNNTTGLILWMSHPAWPSFIWQTYTYDFETPGSYFGAKKGAEPLHIQLSPNGIEEIVSVINTTRQNISGLKVIATIYSPSGLLLQQTEWNGNGSRCNTKSTTKIGTILQQESNTLQEGGFTAKANGQTICFPLTISPKIRESLPESYLIRLELLNDDNDRLSVNDYWRGTPLPPQDLSQLIQISQPRQIITVPGQSDNAIDKVNHLDQSDNAIDIGKQCGKSDSVSRCEITVTNTSDSVIARGIKITATNPITGEQILPLVISDGYFNLLPGEQRILLVEW